MTPGAGAVNPGRSSQNKRSPSSILPAGGFLISAVDTKRETRHENHDQFALASAIQSGAFMNEKIQQAGIRLAELRKKLAARKRDPSFKQNIAEIEREIARLEAITLAPNGD